MMRVTKFFPTVMVAALVAACGGGQTGDLSGQNKQDGRATEGGNGCEDQVHAVSLDDASALGFDAASVLSFAQQRFQSELAWQAQSGGVLASNESKLGFTHAEFAQQGMVRALGTEAIG